MGNCIFCDIVKGKIPSTKLFESQSVLAFLDIMPANKGHALVIPKKHYQTMLDIPEKELCEVISVVKNLGQAVVEATEAHGFNVLQFNKEAAGQVIPHLHFHIIPRYDDDGLNFDWIREEYEENEVEDYAKKIKKFLK